MVPSKPILRRFSSSVARLDVDEQAVVLAVSQKLPEVGQIILPIEHVEKKVVVSFDEIRRLDPEGVGNRLYGGTAGH